ncbi:hypothetical protein ACOMHN_056329 [Nucella lapillus]
MCGGREGTQGCSSDAGSGKSAMEGAWVWVVLTISLCVAMMLVICILRVCKNRHRRHRFFSQVLGPLCRKLGVKVTWADNPQQGRSLSSAGMNVFMVASPSPFSDQPPSYEMAVTYINHAFSAAQPLTPPSYEEITATTTSHPATASPRSPRESDVRAMTADDVNAAMTSSNPAAPLHDVSAAITTDDVNAAITTDDVNAAITTDDVNAAITTDDVNAAITTDDVNTAITTDDINAAITTDDVIAAITTDDVNAADSSNAAVC